MPLGDAPPAAEIVPLHPPQPSAAVAPLDPRDAAIEQLLILLQSAATCGRAFEATRNSLFDIVVSLSNLMNRASEMRKLGMKSAEREIHAATKNSLNSYVALVANDIAQVSPWPDMDEVRRNVQQMLIAAPPGDEGA